MMRKPHAPTAILLRIVKCGSLFVVSLALVLFFLLWLMLSGLGETTVYTERNVWDYNLLTEKAIAQAPRITSDYHFEFHNGDGYPSTNSIIFDNASKESIEALRHYLKSLGYERDPHPITRAEEWRKPDGTAAETFSLSYDAQSRQATLSLIL
ncbi:hypothetical protein [Kosakonia cowanii]|uniref:hypothetical protein n=1 Tax=Kosakonia cowanii TaxID=208223 RepID=UPI004062B453